MWTDEMRAKAMATRAATKAKKEARHARTTSPSNVHSEITRTPDEEIASGFDWEESPLSEAINKAAEMKRELDRVQAIVLRRQNPPKKMWTCWTELMRKEIEIPRSVTSQCLKRGEDGKWKFRDDGRFVTVDGVRTLQPAFCCNFLCYAVYQKYRVTPPAREAQVQP